MAYDAEILDAVVVGAGWAGLGVSAALQGRGLRHRVLERGRVAETWRTQRWDAFHMNTPNVQTVMPGDRYEGADPEGVLTRDAFIALLEDFAERKGLPVDRNCPVTELTIAKRNGAYRLSTPLGDVAARNVVVASGSQNVAKRPDWASQLPPGLRQMNASDYRTAAALERGAVLVVGGGQSGCQIAEDLAEEGRAVFLSTSRTGRLPRRYRGRDIMLWLVESGFLDVRREQIIQALGRIPARGVVGSKRTISLQSLSAGGVVLLGRCTGIRGRHLVFADDVDEHIRFGDEASANVKREIDEYLARAGIDAPAAEPDPHEVVAPRLPDPAILTIDPAEAGIATVVWCVGFRGDFDWIRLTGALDSGGQPLHRDGVGAIPGIYFAGLDFASTRKSGIILAIAEEAPRLVEHMVGRR